MNGQLFVTVTFGYTEYCLFVKYMGQYHRDNNVQACSAYSVIAINRRYVDSVVNCDVVWAGLLWCGVVWCDWCGVVWWVWWVWCDWCGVV